MTLNDIARLMELAKVPRSKTVQLVGGRGTYIIHVPATHIVVVTSVVEQIRALTDTVTVCVLDSFDARPGQHMYVRVQGQPTDEPNLDDAPREEMRRRRAYNRRSNSRSVVLDCVTAVA